MPFVAEMLGIEDLEATLDLLLVIKAHKPAEDSPDTHT